MDSKVRCESFVEDHCALRCKIHFGFQHGGSPCCFTCIHKIKCMEEIASVAATGLAGAGGCSIFRTYAKKELGRFLISMNAIEVNIRRSGGH